MSETILAGVLHGPKDLRVEERPAPALRPGEVLIGVRRVGICGSDIHYFLEGACGAFVPSRPFVPGHELSGVVLAVGGGGNGRRLAPGSRVTVNPARACGACACCRGGRRNLCEHTVMLGSASTNPPTDGALANVISVAAEQCHGLPDTVDDAVGAMLEPFAVALHALKQSRGVSGRRVLVTGAGPIGLLVAMTARAFGAAPVALSDVSESRRATALTLAADVVLDPLDTDFVERARDLTAGGFDTVFEASGAPGALRQAFDVVRAGGEVVQIGTLPAHDIPLPANRVMSREIRFVGSFRYGDIFDEAIRLVVQGRVDLRPLVSAVMPFDRLGEAFVCAAARTGAIKVQVALDRTEGAA